MRPRLPALLLAVAVTLLVLCPHTAAQDAAIQYVYDELGRLTAVVDQQGNVAVYTYDLVGNLLRIDRVNATDIPGALGITLVRPTRGKTGTSVEIFGKGFSATVSANTVRFNGTAAVVTEATPNRLLTTVPTGATTGPITVTVASLTATSPSPFVVGGTVTVSPGSATLIAGQGQQQFDAFEDGAPTTVVTWDVNGIVGGDAGVGTISASGLYTAPPVAFPSTMRVTITATHRDDRAAKGEAQVTVIKPDPVISAAGGVSVRVADLTSFLTQAAGGLSVQVQDTTTLTAAGGVAISLVPVITQVTPSSVARNTTTQVTFTGAGFTGATGLSALPAGNLTFSNLQVIDDSTATVQIVAGAGTGVWAVRVTTPTGASSANGTGGNLFTVTP